MQISDVFNLIVWGTLFLIIIIKFIRSIRIVPTRSEFIVERFGRYHKTLGAGIHALLPFIDKVAYELDLKEETINVPPQECFTKDNVKVEVDGVLYLKVINSQNASYGITDYRFAAIQLAQTTTRSVIGNLELDRTFEERDLINAKVVEVLGEVGPAWGVNVFRFEVKNIVPPMSVQNAMEKQMSAEREKRAIIAKSLGDKESRINRSEGLRLEMINRSEGMKQKQINEAEGRASEIQSLADATAESIEKIAAAIQSPGGREALKMRLSQDYLQQYATLADESTEIIVPKDITNISQLLRSIGLNL